MNDHIAEVELSRRHGRASQSRQWRLSPKRKGTGRREESSKRKGKLVVKPSEQVRVVGEGVAIGEVF